MESDTTKNADVPTLHHTCDQGDYLVFSREESPSGAWVAIKPADMVLAEA